MTEWWLGWLGPITTDWISAVAAVVSAAVVTVAYFYARRQITAWKDEARARRRANVAEEVLAAAQIAADLMRELRSRADRIPRDKVDDPTFIFANRYNHLYAHNSVFSALRLAEIRARPVLQDERIGQAVDCFFQARFAFVLALEYLADTATEAKDMDHDERNYYVAQRKKIFGDFDENDALDCTVSSALKNLDDILGPVIRYEDKNDPGRQ